MEKIFYKLLKFLFQGLIGAGIFVVTTSFLVLFVSWFKFILFPAIGDIIA